MPLKLAPFKRKRMTNKMNPASDKVGDGGSAGERRLIALINEEECCSALHGGGGQG